MEINYELKEQDFLDFNVYHAKESPSIKRSILIQRLMGPIIFLIAGFIAKRMSDEGSSLIILFAVTSLIWFVFYPKYFYWELSRKTSKMLDRTLKENPTANILGQKTILLDSGQLKEIGLDNKVIDSLDSIEKVEETEKHVFIYISTVSAFIVPVEAFENREVKNKFLSELEELIA